MSVNTIGLISGLLVVVSAIPYGLRTYQGRIKPNLTSWSLWSLIGLALLLTYKSSGAQANIWPAVFGFTNPVIITLLILKRNGGWTKLGRGDIACLIFGAFSLGLWFIIRESKSLSQYALYLAIVADACAAIPTITFVWKHPSEDRPFAWAFFALAYGLTMFAITEKTLSNYILPIYMFCGSLSITLPLTIHRIKKRSPLSEWV